MLGTRRVSTLLIVALLFQPSSSLRAQIGGSLMGTVVDDGSGAVLEGAMVSVVGTGIESVTDSEGQFRLPEVPSGLIDLRITLSGYASVVEPIDVYPSEVALVQLRLPQVEATLQELLIIAHRPRTGAVVTEVRPRDNASRSALDLLEEVPGVILRRSGVGGARIRIRGSSSLLANDPAIYLNSIRLDDGLGGSAWMHVLEQIPSEDVKRVQIRSGPSAAAAYAETSNGVILVETGLIGSSRGQ